MDLLSRQIVSWSMQETLTKNIAVDVLQMALKRRGVAPDLFHSDRSAQYASGRYQQELECADIICSMSRKGNGDTLHSVISIPQLSRNHGGLLKMLFGKTGEDQ